MQRDVICQGKPAVLTWVRSSVFGEEEVRIEWHDGTKRDDLLTKPQGVPDDDWFKSLVPDEFPAFTAQDGVTEKRMIVRIRELEQRVAALEAAQGVQKVEVPAFLQDAPPHDVADLIDWTAPPKERQQHLIAKLREINGLIGLAEDRGGRAAPELYTRRDRIESGIRYNRATSVEEL